MQYLYSWTVFFKILLLYLLHRIGLGNRPSFEDYPLPTIQVAHCIFKRAQRTRLRNPEECPRQDPAVFAGNHIKLSDPIVGWFAIYRASKGCIVSGFMMRDDFFRHWAWRLLPFNLDDIVEMLGAIRISRENFQLNQLKPLLNRLARPGSFIMYPNGTRSRSGLAMEYRDGFETPGNVSFFLSHAQRRHPDRKVAAAPMALTVNPATRRKVMAFGPPLYLPPRTRREEQRAFDLALAESIGKLIEVNVLHLVCALIYLFCLHQRGASLSTPALKTRLQQILDQLEDLLVDPAAYAAFDKEFAAALRYLRAKKILHEGEGKRLHLDAARILSAPPLTRAYANANPVKYQVNQILHYQSLMPLLEAAARRLQ